MTDDADASSDAHSDPYRLAFTHLADGVLIADADGCVLDMNAEALRIHGFDSVDRARRPLAEWTEFELRGIDGAVYPVERWPLMRLLRGETLRDEVVEVARLREGTSSHWSFSGSRIESRDGEALIVLRVADVSERVRRRRERERRLGRLDSLVKVTEAAMSSLDLDELLGSLLESLRKAMRADAAVIMLRSEDGLRAGASCGLPPQVLAGFELSPGEGFAGEVASRGTTMHRVDLNAETYAPDEVLRREGIVSVLGTPLRCGGEILGVLHVDWRHPHLFASEEARLLELFAERSALAIENARLYASAEESRRLSEALAEIDRTIHSSLRFEGVMRRVCAEAARGMGVEASAVSLYCGDGVWETSYVHGFPDAPHSRRFTDVAVPGFADCRRSGETVVVSDLLNGERTDPDLAEGYAINSMLVEPLALRDQFLGALTFYCVGRKRAFSEAQRDFARKLAAAVSLALENARLYEREHHIAETLQSSLLAVPQRISGFDLAHMYRSAGEAARVGGDFYDAFETYDGRACFVVGDISGKGLEAAVLTSLMKNTLRAYAMEPGATPDEVLSRTNAAVYAQTPTEIFVTLFLGFVDPFEGSMAYCNAAHPSPLLCRADRSLVHLAATSPIVGAFEHAPFVSSHACLDIGDSLLLYTDGLVECRKGGEQFGDGRIVRAVAESVDSGMPAVIDSLLSAAMRFTGGSLSDDVAVLAATRLAAPAPATQWQQRLDLGKVG